MSATMERPADNVLDHQVGQHVYYLAYCKSEVMFRGVVVGSFWTQDDDGDGVAHSTPPYKVYRVDTGIGDPRWSVHADTYVDHEATRAALATLVGSR